MSKYGFIVTCLTLCISACSSIAPVKDQAAGEARASVPDTPPTWRAVQDRVGTVPIGWVAAFKDPVLLTLVQEAQMKNRNLQVVQATVQATRGVVNQAASALQPSVTGSARAGRTGSVDGGAANAMTIGLEASWEADVWGRLKSGQQATQYNLQAAQADYQFAQYALAAAVARAYFVAIEAQLQVQVAHNVRQALTQTQRVVDLRARNGEVSEQDRALTRSDMAAANERLAASGGARRDAVRALEQLIGRYPAAELKIRNSLPDALAPPPAGLPSNLLERRPDLIAAQYRIAAAMGKTNQAKAARLPQISLTASLGNSSAQLSDLLKPSNLLWTAASNILAPLFDGGARQAAVVVATADQKRAVAAYADAALTAFGDVERALDQRAVLQTRRAALSDAYRDAALALRLSRLRYESGENDLLNVLTIQQRVFGAKSDLLSVQRLQLQQFVELSLALGGNWQSYE